VKAAVTKYLKKDKVAHVRVLPPPPKTVDKPGEKKPTDKPAEKTPAPKKETK
jgi:hypothetical protein